MGGNDLERLREKKDKERQKERAKVEKEKERESDDGKSYRCLAYVWYGILDGG